MSTITVQIFGNTYLVRDELKALGGRWNPLLKCWQVPAAHAVEAHAAVATAPENESDFVDVPLGRHRTGRNNYSAQCPACNARGEDRRRRHLSVLKSNPAIYQCWAGCTPAEIKRSLGLDPHCPIRFTI